MAELKQRYNDKVLILQEVPLHPHAVLTRLEGCFERPSILHITRRDGLRPYTKAPIYDDKYLVVFEDLKVFEACASSIKLDFMFPVVLSRGKSMTDSVKETCKVKELPCAVYVNAFTKEVAYDFIRDLASVKVSDDFCKTLVRRVGLSPQRIISAIMVCEQVGYQTSNISKYVDKYTYIDVYDVIESLLHICRSKAQIKRAALYVHLNRLWFHRYTRNNLVAEVDTLIKVYRALLDGELTAYTMQEYEQSEHVPRYRILYSIELFERINLNELLALRQFLSSASILEVTMRLS